MLFRSAAELTLEVRESNEPAIKLYESTGFTREGVRKNYYTTPVEHALILTRRLVVTDRPT